MVARHTPLLLASGAVLAPLIGLFSPQISAADADAVKRGEYLSLAGSCVGCHQRDGGEEYAGGLAVESPFGAMYSSNITPDEEHGIGTWTEEDFKRSLHQGYSKDVGYIYPSMPYNFYTKITDEDVSDLWAYFKSIEPVNYEPPENTMVFPANIRTGLALWQELEFEEGRFEPVEGKDEEYNRGAYLVEALGHCQACHSPRNLLMGTDEDREYTGAEIHGWYAPSIGAGPMSSIKDWSVEELATFLQTGTNRDNEKVAGEMSAVIHRSLSKLREDDVLAMARYIKEMPESEEPGEEKEATLSAKRRDAGRALYAQNCLGCHQAKGKGIEGAVPTLAGNGTITGKKGNNIVLLMYQGHSADGTWATMPSFADELSARDMADITNYVRTAWGNDAEPNMTVEQVAELREYAEIPEEGQPVSVKCPVVKAEAIQPALDISTERYEQAKTDKSALKSLVEDYRTARADSSTSQVVQALSSVYCRSVAKEDISAAEAGGRIAAFAGEVAQVANRAM